MNEINAGAQINAGCQELFNLINAKGFLGNVFLLMYVLYKSTCHAENRMTSYSSLM